MAKQAYTTAYIPNVVSPKGRISFPHLTQPDINGQYADNKYKVTLLISKETDIAVLKKAVLDCAKQAWPKKQLTLKELLHPFRNGDDKELDGYAGHWYIVAKTKNRPVVVDVARQPLAPEEVYAGCYGRLVLTACSYEQKGQPGVTFLLNVVQKLEDGQPFGANVDVNILDDGKYASPSNNLDKDMAPRNRRPAPVDDEDMDDIDRRAQADDPEMLY